MSTRAVSWRGVLALLIVSVLAPSIGSTQSVASRPKGGWSDDPPALASLVDAARTESDLRVAVDRYLLDKAAIERRYEVPYSPARLARLRTFYQGWTRRLADADFNALNPEGRDRLRAAAQPHRLRRRDARARRAAVDRDGVAAAVLRRPAPAAGGSVRSQARRRPCDRHDVERRRAEKVSALTQGAGGRGEGGGLVTRPGVDAGDRRRARRRRSTRSRTVLADWHRSTTATTRSSRGGSREPFGRLDKALSAYAEALRLHLAGIKPGEPAPIVGDPVLAEGLRADLGVRDDSLLTRRADRHRHEGVRVDRGRVPEGRRATWASATTGRRRSNTSRTWRRRRATSPG